MLGRVCICVCVMKISKMLTLSLSLSLSPNGVSLTWRVLIYSASGMMNPQVTKKVGGGGGALTKKSRCNHQTTADTLGKTKYCRSFQTHDIHYIFVNKL